MLAVRNGDYVLRENKLQTVSGREALLQRIMLKLTARRGNFPFMENFGSRLWTLGQLRPAERQAAAEQYVTEALSGEEGLTVDSVALSETEDGNAVVTVAVSVNGERLSVDVTPR